MNRYVQQPAQLKQGLHMTIIAKFLKDDSGATAIEYGLIAAGISVAIIATVQGLGTKLKSTFTAVSGALN
jgi:pilus assembly protein Flp/PilA